MHFKEEISLESLIAPKELPFSVFIDPKDEHVFRVEGPKIERMLGYTNLEDDKGFRFFQEFMKKNNIIEELEKLGIENGDTVKLYGNEFTWEE